jgi:predicted ATPase/DNA-binding SARP family transcriptional activator
MLSLSLFGHFQATLNDEPLSFPTKSVAALVAYLYLEQGQEPSRPLPRAHVATLLWPDSTDEQGRTNMRQTLFRLRQVVPDTANGDPLILSTNDTLQWNPAYPCQSDVAAFAAYMAEAEPFLHAPLHETPYPALAPLQAAIDLYPDNLLIGFDLLSDFYAEWLGNWRTHYQRQALLALARLAECHGRAGQPRQMEKYARQQLLLNPEREEAHRQLIQACLAQGEYSSALNQYTLYQQQRQADGLEPSPALRELNEQAEQLRLGQLPPSPPIPHNLPPQETPFYGRQQELDDLLLWLITPNERLLTLKGLGGMGKTRLALMAARRLARPWLTLPPSFPGGVWFVSLADVLHDDEQTIAETIAESCGWRSKTNETALNTLTRYLTGKPHLLVLDNLEHLPRMAQFVLTLLTAVPSLTILATSRHQLGLQREVVRHLYGLPLPKHEQDTAVPSVTLLTERLKRVDSHFRLNTAVAPDLVRICRTLDGWPLALELAASWAEVMSLPEIVARVVNNMTTLRTSMPDLPSRHRSIEATLAGSYELLSPQQQQILLGFALFRGGCTAVAATTILQASPEDITLLVRRALVQQQEERYTLHELIRQFATAKLSQLAEPTRTTPAEAHAHYYLQLLSSLEAELHGTDPLPALRQLRPERENISRAWHYAATHQLTDLLTATLPSLTRFYNMTSLLHEGESLLRESRPHLTEPPLSHDLRLAHANFHLRLGHYDTARALLEPPPAIEELPPAQQLETHLRWGKLYMLLGRFAASDQHYQQALTLARAAHHQEGIVSCLVELGVLSDYDERYEAEVTILADSLTDLWLQRLAYSFLGAVSIRHGRYQNTCIFWQKALDISLALEDWYSVASYYNNLGDAFREFGRFAEAEASFQQATDLAHAQHNDITKMSVGEGWARLDVVRGAYRQPSCGQKRRYG